MNAAVEQASGQPGERQVADRGPHHRRLAGRRSARSLILLIRLNPCSANAEVDCMTASNRSVIASRATWKELLSMNVLHRKPSRLGESGSILRHPVFLATAMVVVIAGAILAILLRTGYAGELDEGRARAATLSRLLDEQTARSLQAVDLVLQSMADAMRTFTIPEHDAAFQQLLAKRLQVLPQVRTAVLSGPSFAAEIARGLPAALTLATASEAEGRALAHALSHASFRCYWSDDATGAEIGGALKNVYAIAAGIVAGKKLGESAHAALVTRGFAEMMRFGSALGARRETMTGLSGLGDLILTCGSSQSRNSGSKAMP